MAHKLRIGGACLNQTPIDWTNNHTNITAAIEMGRNDGVDLLCLPELCITGYGCEDLFLSEWLYDKALDVLKSIVPYTANIAVFVGLPMRFEGKNYNCSCLIQNQQILGFYAKQRLANDGVHYEPRWFNAWPSGTVSEIDLDGSSYPFGHTTFDVNGYRVGFEICEDAWQADRPISYIHEHTEIVLNPSASHFAFKKAAFREHLVVDSSEKYKCTYLYTNLLGNEAGRMIYDGDILIASHGKLVARNRRLSFENVQLLAIDLDQTGTTQAHEIRDDFTSQNEEFAHAAGLALFDYLRKSKSKGFVLSLSGGADSSTIATLVAFAVRQALDQLGKEGLQEKLGFGIADTEKDIVRQLLTTAYQATIHSSEDTFLSAKGLADSLGATFYDWKIDTQVNHARDTIEQAIGRDLSWAQDDITLQNIQARSRSPIIWMLTNLKQALLLATSNRSEGDVGYATMDGDTSGSISPIAGVSKHFVLQWLHYAENELGYAGLRYVNQLTPTAELRPEDQHQTDEDDLMPYEVLVKIEREAILNRQSPQLVYDSLSADYDADLLKEWIRKYFQLWTRNQWKRERLAPSFHFDDFNIDPRSWYRFPILSGGYKEELEAL